MPWPLLLVEVIFALCSVDGRVPQARKLRDNAFYHHANDPQISREAVVAAMSYHPPLQQSRAGISVVDPENRQVTRIVESPLDMVRGNGEDDGEEGEGPEKKAEERMRPTSSRELHTS